MYKLQVCIPAFMKHSPFLQIRFAYLFRIVLDNLLFLRINFIIGLQSFAAIMNMEMAIEGYSINLTTIRAHAKYLISTKLKKTSSSSDLNIPLTYISLELF
jgi:hypothetical protein